MVKSSKPQLKYICFGKDGERIYKGEGTLTFTAYYPFAKSVFKFLEKEIEKETGKEVYVLRKTYPNIEEWAEASGMKAQGALDKVPKSPTEGVYPISVYNAGDLEADFILKFNGAPNSAMNIELSQQNVAGKKGFLNLKKFDLKGTDTGFQINTKTNLIEGFNTKGLTGILYNENITQGDFFKIPPREDYQISVTGATPTEIVYDYIYY